MAKKLTIKELIKQKNDLKNKKEKPATLYVESLDSEIVVKAPSTDIILEAQSQGENDATRADKYIILECTKEPNLKDKELQEAYGCVEPLDIVEHIFAPGEISGIAVEIMSLAGYGNSVKRVVNDIKN
ncbi:Phage XkdN-like tail assembly chaperone protein, TAC [Anaerovirgula multivorans]|uniref:Phage XkdN-like tail assembly chaperone protein, TAC n=1 Tax=Anaerovirgula multivorans TaxID=312168 RepID=A0A238ZRK9_9FIRM|nr:hypothetical protein [Anaerovirgula multivorans]SNR86066.1 Phage XkdN-like tail assembly chaperone protein, TAC [Anaerovirgula multivorans]